MIQVFSRSAQARMTAGKSRSATTRNRSDRTVFARLRDTMRLSRGKTPRSCGSTQKSSSGLATLGHRKDADRIGPEQDVRRKLEFARAALHGRDGGAVQAGRQGDDRHFRGAAKHSIGGQFAGSLADSTRRFPRGRQSARERRCAGGVRPGMFRERGASATAAPSADARRLERLVGRTLTCPSACVQSRSATRRGVVANWPLFAAEQRACAINLRAKRECQRWVRLSIRARRMPIFRNRRRLRAATRGVARGRIRELPQFREPEPRS